MKCATCQPNSLRPCPLPNPNQIRAYLASRAAQAAGGAEVGCCSAYVEVRRTRSSYIATGLQANVVTTGQHSSRCCLLVPPAQSLPPPFCLPLQSLLAGEAVPLPDVLERVCPQLPTDIGQVGCFGTRVPAACAAVHDMRCTLC